jgi:L,D-transpeptidase catalytic domain
MRRHAVVLAAALAWFIGIESAEAKLDILVDKATQRMLVIQDGYIRYMWPVSTGRDELATPNGVYAPQRLERSWFSSAYYNSPMPYSIFFHNGYAIHGSYAIDKLGGPASHGCVRLHPHHAQVLFDLVQQEGPENTTIEVTDDPRPEEPPLPPREIAAAQALYPPVPRIVRYRELPEMPELPATPRDNRSLLARNDVPSRAVPAGRRIATDARPAASVARAAASAAQVNAANNSVRLAGESSDSSAKAKSADGAPMQQGGSIYGFKLLPTSCWTGGASRWRWWSSGQETSCR